MRAVLVGTVAVVLLAGCAAQPQVPPGLTDEEANRLILVALAQDMAQLQQQVPGAEGPSVVGEDVAANWDDWMNLQTYCLRAAGFDPVTISEDGVFVGGDTDSVRKARVHCAYRFPLDPRLRGALSSEQAEYAWDYWDARLIPCVEELGYTVPGVPARPEFVRNAVGRIGRLPWTPYLAMRVQSDEEKAVIDAACPPLPEDPYNLYENTALPLFIVQSAN
jgi:hypothetical protein